jgi:hypothetical protein
MIETQQRNEDRAMFGKGIYQVHAGFKYFTIDEVESHAQMTKK